MEYKIKVKLHLMPNFIALDLPARKREDGIQNNTIPVEELSKEQAEEYAELMKSGFLEHWKRNVEQKNNEEQREHLR